MMIASLDDFIPKWQIHDFPPEILDTPGPTRRFKLTSEISNGDRQFARKCSVCHTLVEDGAKRAGPTLYNIFGREAGTLPGYKYSKALAAYDKNWTFEELNGFLIKPAKWIKGTKMAYAGLRKEKDRASVIKYLNENSDSPLPLP